MQKSVSVGVYMLRKVVNESEMTIEQWCGMLGVSKTTFMQILKGNRVPSARMQILLNKPLGLVNDWLNEDAQYEDEKNLRAKGL